MTGAYRNQVARSLLGVVLSSSIVLASAPAVWAQQPTAPPPAGAQPLPSPGAAPTTPSTPAYPPAAQPGAPAGGTVPSGTAPATGGAMQPTTPGAMQPAPGAVPPAPAPGAPTMTPDANVGPADVTSDAAPPVSASGFTNSKVPAYVAFGLAGAGLVVGTAFGISALSAKSEYQDTPTYAKAEAVEDRSLYADVGFATFILAGLTGAIFYLNQPGGAAPVTRSPPGEARRQPKTQTGFRFEPTVSQKVQGGSLTLRF